ncbi:Golgin subfamily A member 2 [Tupaia chinensis]|uniref:Golgin subfamily A member 2 n=1 Tax=Tupaia chinensis TaxID=246437 RepID=L9JD64_TUPCH|nr:Golgin subfamily A member 2 [Tupaia chinensis]
MHTLLGSLTADNSNHPMARLQEIACAAFLKREEVSLTERRPQRDQIIRDAVGVEGGGGAVAISKVEVKSQETQGLQQQHNLYAIHLQQYAAAYQMLASEKELLQKQLLLQTQITDCCRRKFRERCAADVKHLEAVTQQNQQLWAQLHLIGLPGEGGLLDKEAPQFKLGLLEELESPETVVKLLELQGLV